MPGRVLGSPWPKFISMRPGQQWRIDRRDEPFFAHGFVFYYTSMSSLPRSDQVSGVSRQINHDELFMRQRKKKKMSRTRGAARACPSLAKIPLSWSGGGCSPPGLCPALIVFHLALSPSGNRLFPMYYFPPRPIYFCMQKTRDGLLRLTCLCRNKKDGITPGPAGRV